MEDKIAAIQTDGKTSRVVYEGGQVIEAGLEDLVSAHSEGSISILKR